MYCEIILKSGKEMRIKSDEVELTDEWFEFFNENKKGKSKGNLVMVAADEVAVFKIISK